MRQKLSLNGKWDFDLLEEHPENISQIKPSRKIAVPSCIESYYPEITQKQYYAYYSKIFTLKRKSNKRYFLVFGAVDYKATVFLNGKYLGEHEGGYTSFEFEVTDFLKEENQIQVIVFDPIDNSIINFKEIPHGKQNGEPNWYTNITGIWQEVYLEERPTSFLKDARIKTSLLKKCLECSYKIDGDYDNITLVLNKYGKEIKNKTSKKGEKISLELEDIKPWSPEKPQLYDLHIIVKSKEQKDIIHKRVAFSDFSAKDGKLLLNGKDFYMIGVLDQDFYPDTLYTIPSKEYLKKTFIKLKKMGINTLRFHVKVPDPIYMELADEMGFIVWQDAPYFDNFSTSSAKKLEKTILKTLERDITHPSLCIYSIINESWGINLDIQEHRDWLESIFYKIKSIYPDLVLIDNSPCMGNYHLISDINDYHFYTSAIDREELWNFYIDDFTENPQNKFYKGYEENTKNLPLLVSEFGNWSLPGLKWIEGNRKDFWKKNEFLGEKFTLADGALERFEKSDLSKEFTLNEFFDISTAHQLENLRIEISKIKKKSSIRGYIITELADTFWECNGLLDFDRQYKYNPEKIKRINSLNNAFKIKSGNIFFGENLQFLIAYENDLEDVQFKINNRNLDAHENLLKTRGSKVICAITLSTPTLDDGLHYLSVISKKNDLKIPFTVTQRGRSNIFVTKDYKGLSVDEIYSGKKIVLILDKANMNFELESYKAKTIEKNGMLSGDWISGFPWISKEFSNYFPDSTFLKVHSTLIKGVPLIDANGYDRRLSGITYGWFYDFYGYLDLINIGKGKLFITTLNLLENEALSTGILSTLEKI
ncbi:MAG: glycoside hydrolase family 2 TIM barrel-domain containing protein [Kosmotogaceae bacterium]